MAHKCKNPSRDTRVIVKNKMKHFPDRRVEGQRGRDKSSGLLWRWSEEAVCYVLTLLFRKLCFPTERENVSFHGEGNEFSTSLFTHVSDFATLLFIAFCAVHAFSSLLFN